jgi:hypothetical protein
MLNEAGLTDFSSAVLSLWQALQSQHPPRPVPDTAASMSMNWIERPLHAGEKAGQFIEENVGRLYDRGWEGQFDRHKSVSPLLNIAYVRADLADALGDVAVRLVWLTKRPLQSNLDTARAACKRYLELAEVELPDAKEPPEIWADDQQTAKTLSHVGGYAKEHFGHKPSTRAIQFWRDDRSLRMYKRGKLWVFSHSDLKALIEIEDELTAIRLSVIDVVREHE